MISQAPNNPNPSGLQPVASTGAALVGGITISGHAKPSLGLARRGEALRHPAERGQFSRLGWARRGAARLSEAVRGRAEQGYNATCGDIAGQFSWPVRAGHGVAGWGVATTRAWRGIQAQFLISGQGVAGLDQAG